MGYSSLTGQMPEFSSGVALTKANANTESLGKRIARIRKSQGFTQTEFADALGLRQPNVSDYERDIRRPSMEVLIRLADVLKTSTDELLGLATKNNEAPLLTRKLAKRMQKIEMLTRRDQQALMRTIDAFLGKAG